MRHRHGYPRLITITALVIATILAPQSAIAAEPLPSAGFSDTRGHWACDTIELLHSTGVVSPLSGDRFGPDQPMTRLDFASWVVRSLGEEPSQAEVDFDDAGAIPAAARGEVARAVELELIEGYPDGTFRPADTVTRVQMATILGRVLMTLGVPAQTRFFGLFRDGDQIPDWALPAAAAVRQELVIGRATYPERVFAPADPITRAEAATMLERFINQLEELDSSGIFAPPSPDHSPLHQYLVAGWYMGTDAARGESYQSMSRFGSRVNMVIMSSGYGFTFDDKGELQLTGYDSPFLFSEASKRDDQTVLVRITNSFDSTVSDRILNDRRNSRKAMEAIRQALGRGYDGVNIDFENVSPGDRRALNDFMTLLWRELSGDYIITMAVPAKTVDNPQHGWSGAFDYATLGRCVHYLMPMAYDFHWGTGAPGSVAPIGWTENVVRYTLSVVPEEKVLLGAPFYGYDWEDIDEPHRARSVWWPEAVSQAQQHGATIEWSEEDRTPFYRYITGDGVRRIVHFENEHSLRARLSLVTEYNLAGVAFWRLGQQAPEAWPVIREVLD
ncbi:MAG: S-layer homology domain-containing protein [Bacillota bacterium]